MKRFSRTTLNTCLLAVGLVAGSQAALAEVTYQVTITNLTAAQSMTPFLVATHAPGEVLFTAGQPASSELADIAEGGDVTALQAVLDASADVDATVVSEGLLDPSFSTSVTITADSAQSRLSLVAMLIPTNDAMASVQNVRLPRGAQKIMLDVPAYDAGTETNDELCLSIPGPVCGGAGISPDDEAEGFVHIHSGIHGIGDLAPSSYDWNNPVARILIERVD